jgi:hypothetical protein
MGIAAKRLYRSPMALAVNLPYSLLTQRHITLGWYSGIKLIFAQDSRAAVHKADCLMSDKPSVGAPLS